MNLASSFVNLDKCSEAFQAAIARLDAGHDVRRASWPVGMFLRLETSGLVGIYRNGTLSTPSWSGMDGQLAADWTTV
jgi:hypothetical protein